MHEGIELTVLEYCNESMRGRFYNRPRNAYKPRYVQSLVVIVYGYHIPFDGS